MQLCLKVPVLLVYLTDVDAPIALLIVDDFGAHPLVLHGKLVVRLDLPVKLLLDGVAPPLLIGEALVKGLILARDVLTLCLQFYQLGLAILDVGVRLHVVEFVLFVKLIVLVLDDAQLVRAVGVALLQHFTLEGGGSL